MPYKHKAKGIREKSSRRAFRQKHTFATNLYIIGVPEKDRQEYMGHVSGSPMTNDVYTTFTPDVKAENIYNIYGDFLPKF